MTKKTRTFHIEKDQISSGEFWNEFKAADQRGKSKCAARKYIQKAVKNME